MRDDTLARFVLRVFLWIPLCFAAWYMAAAYHGVAAGWLAQGIANAFQPDIVKAIERSGTDLVFVTRIPVRTSATESGMLVAEVAPMIYNYGLALFLALMLASRSAWWKLVAGAVALLPFEAWGMAFDFLAQAGVKLGPRVASQAGFSAAQREAIVFGYQAGALIFPTLVPVLLWAALNRPSLEALLRPEGRAAAPSR